MRIGQDQSLQHLDRCLLILGNGDQPIAELRDSIHIPPDNPYKIQDDSGIAIKQSDRHFVGKIFPDITAILNAPEHHWIAEKAILTSKNSSVDQINAISSQNCMWKQHSIQC